MRPAHETFCITVNSAVKSPQTFVTVMEIRKAPVYPSPPAVQPRQHQAATVPQKRDIQRLSSSEALAQRNVELCGFDPDEFAVLVGRLEDRNASTGAFGAESVTSTTSDRIKKALCAYQLHLDMPQDETHALRQMLGIDTYA
jgi:hypothetical protein